MEPKLPSDSLYFGSNVVSLSVVGGHTEHFSQGCTWGDLAGPPSQNTPYDGVDDPRGRLGSMAHLGNDEGYVKVRIPAVPAVDIAGELDREAPKGFAEALKEPLLKTPMGSLFGVSSGTDSALVPLGKSWYRLRGCGHFAAGFPTAPIFPESRTVNTSERIEGCSFEHTSKRDLHMTQVVNDLLDEYGMIGGNQPVGRWCYDVMPSPLTAAPLPAVPKYCSLFVTKGDKKLASDVLIGLERMLPLFCPGAKATELMKLFPEGRYDAEKPGGVLRTFEWIFDHERMKGEPQPTSNEGLVNLCEVQLPERVPSACPEEVPSRYRTTWNSCQVAMQSFLTHESRDGDMLAHIVWRLGREAGKIRRILSNSGISWGFYYDHHPNVPENGSLPDNFVLLPPGCNDEQLIAPINFDKAYTRENFLLGTAPKRFDSEEGPRWPTEEDEHSGKVGTADVGKFNKWLNREEFALEMALGGDKGLANVDYAEDTEIDTHVAALLMTALTDTCVLGFRSGYNLEEDAYPMDPDLATHTYELLQMALCLSEA